MPVPLLRHAKEYSRQFKALDKEYFDQAKGIFLDLDEVILRRAKEILSEIYGDGRTVDWTYFERNRKRLLNVLTARVAAHYDKVATIMTTAERRIFFMSRDLLMGRLKELYPITAKPQNFNLNKLMAEGLQSRVRDLVEQEHVVLNVGAGGVSKEFQHFLKSQLQVGERPADLIRTMSARQIEATQREFLKAVREGMDLKQARTAVLDSFAKNITSTEFKLPTQYEVMRVLRQSHTEAARASTVYFAKENGHLVTGFTRVAGPRCCLACAAEDGRLYDDPSQFSDHIGGQCLLVPELKTLGEMGLPYKPEYEAAWRRELPPTPSAASQFYSWDEKAQRSLFNNNRLYDLWKSEKFPLERLMTRDATGAMVPMSYQQAVANFMNWGGVSSPKVGLAYKTHVSSGFTTANDKAFLGKLDPRDRATKEMVAVRDLDASKYTGMTNEYGQSLFGMGTDGSVPVSVENRARVLLAARDVEKATWYDFNAYARELGLWTRKATDGSVYWVVPKQSIDEVIKGVGQEIFGQQVTSGKFRKSKTWEDLSGRLERASVKNKIEAFMTIDENSGAIVDVQLGEEHAVHLARYLDRLSLGKVGDIDDITGRALMSLHNHPNSSAFSVDDVLTFMNLHDSGFRRHLVRGADGTIYKMEFTDNFMRNIRKAAAGHADANEFVANSYKTIYAKRLDYYNGEVVAGRMTSTEAYRKHSHEIIQELSRQLFFTYERISP